MFLCGFLWGVAVTLVCVGIFVIVNTKTEEDDNEN